MNVSIIFTRSKVHDPCLYLIDAERTPFKEEDKLLMATIHEALVKHELCWVAVIPPDVTVGTFLEDSKLCTQIVAALKLCAGKPCSISIHLLRNYGYLLRMARFATELKAILDTIPELKGSTVIADLI